MFKKPMRKIFGLGATVALIATLLMSGIEFAWAQATTKSLSTNFTLVNLTGNEATVVAQYLKDDGTAWTADVANTSFQIAAYGQKPVYQYFDNTLTSGKGSIVVQSDQQLGAVVQLLAKFPTGQTPTSGAYSSVDPASKFYAPLILHKQLTSSGVTESQIMIQNAGTTDLSGVTVAFFNSSAGALVYTKPVPTIKAGATYYYDLSTETSLPSPFAGAATIDAGTGRIVAVVNVFFGPNGLQTYSGISSDKLGTSWAVPLFNSRLGNGLSTVVSVQNLSGGTIPIGGVVMTCNAFAGSASPAVLTLSNPAQLADGQSYSFNPVADLTIPALWYGSCKVNTAAGVNTAAIIQMRFIGTDNSAAYEAIPAGSTDKQFFTPLVQKRLSNGFATNTTVVNLNPTQVANVTVTYTPSPDYVTGGGSSAVLSFSTTIPGGSSLQQNQRLADFAVGTTAMPNGWYGSLKVVSTDQPIAGFTQITNINSPAGDTFMTFDGFTQP